ncbi:peroxiredoxin family protein [Thioalkalivibrio sp.]|uniref:peroxiredoxin family protein n=1 Tax=Thioalkalivibrio sp. TaxID=2093813 RepID=UPI0039771720
MNRHHRHPRIAVFGVLAAFTLLACAVPDEGARAGENTPTAAETVAAADAQEFRRIDFTLPDLDGEPRRFSEWDGDLVLLNFWATWCPPCKKEMPMFQDRYAQYAEQGFTIVAVAVDELAETQAFVDSFGIGFPILIGQDEAMAVGRAYGNRIGALPYSLLIDRDGIVRETHRGEVTETDLDGWLQRYL